MTRTLRTAILIGVLPAILGCQSDPLSLDVDVYYLVFDRLRDDSPRIRALYWVPAESARGLEFGEAVTLTFARESKELHLAALHASGEEPNKQRPYLTGRIEAFSADRQATGVLFDCFPITVTNEQYERLKYEEGVTKVIRIYFEREEPDPLRYVSWKFKGTVPKPPVRPK